MGWMSEVKNILDADLEARLRGWGTGFFFLQDVESADSLDKVTFNLGFGTGSAKCKGVDYFSSNSLKQGQTYV